MPAYVTCRFPSGRRTTPSEEAATPAPARGFAPFATRSGGHAAVQEPLQGILPPLSPVRWYSVRPVAVTRTFFPSDAFDAARTVTGAPLATANEAAAPASARTATAAIARVLM